MKRKKIEAIPWILPEGKRFRKTILFAAAADIQKISGEENLIVDIWQKGRYKMPLLRAAYTKTDWGLLYPKTGEWTREKINGRMYYADNELKAATEIKGKKVYAERMNTWISQASAEKIYQFVDKKPVKKVPWYTWIDELRKQQDRIESGRRDRKYQRRMEALRQRQADTPEIPEAFREWMADRLKDNNFLYYRKKGRRVTVRCSHCGEEYEGYTRRIDTFEGKFQHIIPYVENKNYGYCENCGTRGMYRPIGRMNGTYGISVHGYLLQPYHEKDFVLRYFMYEKWLRTDCAEENALFEIARAYVTPEKIQCDYHKAGMVDSYWDDCNLAGMSNIEMKEGQIWQGSWPLVQGTRCTHTGLQEYASRKRELRPALYLGMWKEKPCLEVLAKCDLYKTTEAVLECRATIKAAMARRPAEILGVYPYRVKMIRENHGDMKLVKTLQLENVTDMHFTQKQIQNLMSMNLAEIRGCASAFEIMPVQKLINRIYRYAGQDPDIGFQCAHAEGILRQAAECYLDYLSMRRQAGDDLTDSIIQCPRDLHAAHAEMVRMINDHKEEMHIRKKEDEFPNIRKHYRALRKKYFWEDDAYIIRPARSAGEIIMEGRTLHHCVGGDNYLEGHDSMTRIILFLRLKETPEVPYITVEIGHMSNTIHQWYGIRDTKPDKEAIDRWLRDYVSRLFRYGSMAVAIMKAMETNTVMDADTMGLLAAAAG